MTASGLLAGLADLEVEDQASTKRPPMTWDNRSSRPGYTRAAGERSVVLALQATAVLVVDAFDEETAGMWRDRFGFRPSTEERGGRRRLWVPLETEVY